MIFLHSVFCVISKPLHICNVNKGTSCMELKHVAVFHLCSVDLILLGNLWLILSCPREVIQLAEEGELSEILERLMDPKP